MTDDLVVRLADIAGRPLVALQDSGPLDGEALGRAGDGIADAFIGQPVEAVAVAPALGVAPVPIGPAGAEATAVVRGEAGGQRGWDGSAPVAIATTEGPYASRIDGSPLVHDAAAPYPPDVLTCYRDLAPRVLEPARSEAA